MPKKFLILSSSAALFLVGAERAYAHVGTPYTLVNTDTFLQKFLSGVSAGIYHIGSGIDHLLFLFMLLLPATAVIKNHRWVSGQSFKISMKSILKTVSAFTLGHATSVVLSSLNIFSLPEKPVEILIALSIFVTALHALRPTMNRFFLLLPVLFGLIHGLAFASMLKQLVVFQSDRILTLFAFNIGIELAQVLLVMLTLPSLWWLSKTSWNTGVRISFAVLGLLLAEFWIGERTFNLKNPALALTNFLETHNWFIPALIAALALLANSRLEWRGERRT